MSEDFDLCFECGATAHHSHHVIPRVYGGRSTVRLCERCHGLVHDRKFLNHSVLTKQGLAAAKAHGVKLGGNGKAIAALNKAVADEFAANLKILVEKHITSGLTRAEIAEEFNAAGIATARGGKWHVTSVQRMVKRLGLAADKTHLR